jgi:two-component system chemotaxis response regulator CheB
MKQAVPIRVLAFDGSTGSGAGLRQLLRDAKDISLAGLARRPAEMVDLVRTLKPNLITVSTEGVASDAVDVTRMLMEQAPSPIVVLASDEVAIQVKAAMQAMEAGALAVIPPTTGRDPRADARALATLRAMAGMKVVRRWPARAVPPAVAAAPAAAEGALHRRIVAIAASTGGPAVLHRILSRLPARFAAPVLVVQHIARGFAAGLADWLAADSALPVKLARAGEAVQAGTIYIAENDLHLGVSPRGTVTLSNEPPIEGFRPSASFLFSAVARTYGRNAVGVVLTGMGEDGASGLCELHAAGGRVLAQDEARCVVFGMPAAAIRQGATDAVLTPDAITEELIRSVGRRKEA